MTFSHEILIELCADTLNVSNYAQKHHLLGSIGALPPSRSLPGQHQMIHQRMRKQLRDMTQRTVNKNLITTVSVSISAGVTSERFSSEMAVVPRWRQQLP